MPRLFPERPQLERRRADNSAMGLLDAVVELLFVPHCPACDARVQSGQPLCETCSVSLYELGTACPRCAEPLTSPVAVVCSRCKHRPLPFRRAFAPYRYGGELAVALQRLKFSRRPDIARSLAPLFTPALIESARDADIAMPIPLHRRRLAKRGFNQAQLILAQARGRIGIPIDARLLRRRRNTDSQTGLDARQRRRNVDGAFALVRGGSSRVAGQRILLVDDVMTTGATLAAAATCLLAAGAASVIAFSAARAEMM